MPSAWPSTLPQSVLVSNYSDGVGDGLLEYQPDAGPSITRRRTSASVRSMTMNFQLTSAQIVSLRSFFETTLISGSLPFTFPDPLTGSSVLVKFSKSGIPKWTALGGDYFSVTMSVWVLP